MKESIVSFANDSIKIINENLNLNDLTNSEDNLLNLMVGFMIYVNQ